MESSRHTPLTWPRARMLAAAVTLIALALALPGLAASPRPAAPPTAGVTLDGKRLSLADLRGKPVILNVWSSW